MTLIEPSLSYGILADGGYTHNVGAEQIEIESTNTLNEGYYSGFEWLAKVDPTFRTAPSYADSVEPFALEIGLCLVTSFSTLDTIVDQEYTVKFSQISVLIPVFESLPIFCQVPYTVSIVWITSPPPVNVLTLGETHIDIFTTDSAAAGVYDLALVATPDPTYTGGNPMDVSIPF